MINVREEVADLLQKVLQDEIDVSSVNINITPRYREVDIEQGSKTVQVGTDIEVSIKGYEYKEAHV